MLKATTLSHRAYLLRCWREKSASDEEHPWRFSVEEVLHERRRKAFGSLQALFAFLQDELACPKDELDLCGAAWQGRPH